MTGLRVKGQGRGQRSGSRSKLKGGGHHSPGQNAVKLNVVLCIITIMIEPNYIDSFLGSTLDNKGQGQRSRSKYQRSGSGSRSKVVLHARWPAQFPWNIVEYLLLRATEFGRIPGFTHNRVAGKKSSTC